MHASRRPSRAVSSMPQSRAPAGARRSAGRGRGSSMPGPILTVVERRPRTRCDDLVVDRAARPAAASPPSSSGRRSAAATLTIAGHGFLEVGVGEDDVRGLAAELELERREPARARLGDLRAGGRRADERHVIDAGARRARRRSSPSPVATWNIPRGTPARSAQIGEPQRRDRRQLGRLEDHGVARRERGRGAAGGDLQRVVPGDDLRRTRPTARARV